MRLRGLITYRRIFQWTSQTDGPPAAEIPTVDFKIFEVVFKCKKINSKIFVNLTAGKLIILCAEILQRKYQAQGEYTESRCSNRNLRSTLYRSTWHQQNLCSIKKKSIVFIQTLFDPLYFLLSFFLRYSFIVGRAHRQKQHPFFSHPLVCVVVHWIILLPFLPRAAAVQAWPRSCRGTCFFKLSCCLPIQIARSLAEQSWLYLLSLV